MSKMSKEAEMFCKSHSIFIKRNMELAVTYDNLNKAFNDYRQKVLNEHDAKVELVSPEEVFGDEILGREE